MQHMMQHRWLRIGVLAALVSGCSDYGGGAKAQSGLGVPDGYVPPGRENNWPTHDVITGAPIKYGPAAHAKREDLIEVFKTNEANFETGDFDEKWWSLDPRAGEIFGWDMIEMTSKKTGEKRLVASCTRENCFFEAPQPEPDLEDADDYVIRSSDALKRFMSGEIPSIDSYTPEVAKGMANTTIRTGKAYQSSCEPWTASKCPGPWNAAIGGVVPDNAAHLVCTNTIGSAWANGYKSEILQLSNYNYTLPNLGIDNEGIDIIHIDGPIYDPCPGWTNDDIYDLEDVDQQTVARRWDQVWSTGTFRWAPASAMWNYSSSFPTADVLFVAENLASQDTPNCAVMDFYDNPHPLLGCAHHWLLTPQNSLTTCFWEKYQQSCPRTSSPKCDSCPYVRSAGATVAISNSQIQIAADYYGLPRIAWRAHVIGHEFGHTLGFTHPVIDGQRLYPDQVGSIMAGRHPTTQNMLMTTFSAAEICEMRGAGWITHDYPNCSSTSTTANSRERSGRRLIGAGEY